MSLIRPAVRHERANALRLLLGHVDAADRESRVQGVLDLMISGEIDPDGLFVLPKLTGATLAVALPGAGGILWPPVCDDESNAAQLIETACAWLRARGVRLIQALIPTGQITRTGRLLASGFRLVTNLVTLVHPLRLTVSIFQTEPRLTYEPYTPGLFHDVLERTYVDTLDCPEISGIRSIDEVILGHKGQGPFDPQLWWLVRERSEPVGVVIQIDSPANEERELAYVGIVPEARRRGIGREVMLRVLMEARADGVGLVVLSVDERNVPAWRLYALMGFEEVGRQQVFLRLPT